MKTTKGKIITKIAIALAILSVSTMLVFYILPLNTSEEKMNLIVGAVAAVGIYTVFSIFATIQESKQLKKT